MGAFRPEEKTIVDAFEIAVRGGWSLKEGKSRRRDIAFVLAKNSKYAFRLNTTSRLTGYTIEFLEQLGMNPVADTHILQADAEVRFFVPGTWHLRGQALEELVNSPFFQMKRISTVPSNGDELVRVEFEYLIDDPQRKQERFSEAWMICDPARGWALNEYGGILWSGALYRVELEPGELVNGFPIAKTVTVYYSLPSASKVIRRTTTSIEIISREVPEVEFYLSHYGLPEPNFSGTWAGPWVWYLAGGIACLVIGAIILKRRKAPT